MPPDINSLPPSPPTTSTPSRSISSAMSLPYREDTPSPRPSTHSLAAAAAINATERRSSYGQGSPRLDRRTSERRRSQVAMNLNLNDPSLPGPGELPSSDRRSSIGNAFSTASPPSIGGRTTLATGDPHHHRQPSLGEIHNSLEQEQEAQVNRMLLMIRSQQQQLDTLRTQQSAGTSAQSGNSTAIEETTPQSERSFSFPSVHPAVGSIPRPARMSRENSTSNRSPALRPLPSQDLHSYDPLPPSPSASTHRGSLSRRDSLRDENAYYQAEYTNLQRENQMLRVRIRELERQVQEKLGTPPATPVAHSNLVTSPPLEALDKN